jgi:choice-of-anchor B domain-containing protein
MLTTPTPRNSQARQPHAAAVAVAVLIAAVVTGALAAPGAAQTWRGSPVQPPGMAGFGGAVAVGNGEVFVGEAGNVMRPGLVYVYRRSGTRWSEALQIKASTATYGDGFGSDIAVSGNTLAVAAAKQNAIYLFTKSAAGAWTQSARLTDVGGMLPETGPLANAPLTVAVNGDVLLVGSPGANEGAGVVNVYRRSAGTWQKSGAIAAAAAAGDLFGTAIWSDGSQAWIGSPGKGGRAGAVQQFEWRNGVWTAGASLTGPGIEANGGFGVSVAMNGDELLVGAPGFDGSTGAVFAFSWNERGNQWQPVGRFLPYDGAHASFGSAIAVTDNALWISGPAGGGRRGGFAGGAAIYVFDRDGNSITGSRRLTMEGGGRGGFSTIAAAAGVAVAGAPGVDGGLGAAVIYDVNGTQLAESRVESRMEALDPMVGKKVDCAGGKISVFDCGDVDLMGFLPNPAIGAGRGVRLNDIWGWTDEQTGKEYALVGRSDGTAFVDISDPSNPVYVGQLLKTEESPNSVWRDIKTYKNHAYVVSDAAGDHGVQVVDLTKLRDFKGTPLTLQPVTTYHGIHSAHNIVINEESGFAYSVGSSSGGETCGGGLHMIDIRNPEKPEFAGCFADPQTGRASTGYSHDAQCVMYHGPDADYKGHEICMGANETMLSIADVTDKKNPKMVSHIAYPNVGYTHQGWFTDDQRYFYMDDELDEINQNNAGTPFKGTRTLIWDVSDLDDPQLAKEFYGTVASSDHNLYVKGNLVYQSNYNGGLRVLDISNPLNPVEVGYFDTVPWSPNSPGFDGSWSNYPYFKSGVVVVTSGREGLFIVKKRPTRPIS